MSRHDIIAVGASAGGLDALAHLVRGLSPDLRATLLVVLHISEKSFLPDILSREGPLAATHAHDGERPAPGHIYVAPPRHHLLLEGDHLRLVHGPRENRHRPAIDPLFRSVARSRREQAIGVILSGMLDDGVAGLFAIKARGGLAVVQNPADAAAPSMPRAALRYVDPDYCMPARDLGPLLSLLSKGDFMPTPAP
jgi:two-component system chemotaxis response regulator CheB